MLILGIETTCDDTAAAIVQDGHFVLSNIIASQADLHAKYGGVVPELGSRLHLERLPIVVSEAIKIANINPKDISAIAVASNPGLAPALAVGYSYASSLANGFQLPLIDVDHLKAHIWANFLTRSDTTPILKDGIGLLVSGGHTQLLEIQFQNNKFNVEIIGQTHDDAAGECLDKVARMLDLPYPGGPNIEKLAMNGNKFAIEFPRPLLEGWTNKGTGFDLKEKYNFSFSGLKSAVGKYMAENNNPNKADVAASMQHALVDVLVQKTISLANERNYKQIYIAGGVSANRYLREYMTDTASKYDITVSAPNMEFCLDNAAMIAGLGYEFLK